MKSPNDRMLIQSRGEMCFCANCNIAKPRTAQGKKCACGSAREIFCRPREGRYSKEVR